MQRRDQNPQRHHPRYGSRRKLLDPPVTPRGIAARRELEAATRELEALIAAWDGDGAPLDAMAAWASRVLAS